MAPGGELSTQRTPDERGAPRRLIVAAEGALSAHPLPEEGTLVVGRSVEAELVVSDLSVSRRHARFVLENGSAFVEDLGTPNGTFVNGARLGPEERRPLRAGDAVRVGSVGMFVQAAAAAPVRGARALSGEVVVASAAMKRVHALVDRVAGSSLSVLVRGETGTGKEVVARRIHAGSPRAAGPFLAIDCGALPGALFESELFGFEKGAFTGAAEAKRGLLEAASGGTLFLDEIGELPSELQPKLLRVLEEREVMPIGATRPRRIDVRFVAATNRDLEGPGGPLRPDLYFRLAGATIAIPPLRERSEEILPLARHFLARFAAELGVVTPALAPETASLLREHAWPGNVRELRNAMQHALVFSNGAPVGRPHLPATIASPGGAPLEEIADERTRIVAALDACGGNQTSAAKRLGIPRRTFVRKLDQYGLSRPRKPPRG